jgi:hypothetical protein
LGETVFHDLPDDSATQAEVFRADLLTLRAGTIGLAADVDLADLTDAGLAGYGFARTEVVDTMPSQYPVTRRWGQHLWETTTCAGLVWNSRRTPDRLAVMLFVDPPGVRNRSRSIGRRRGLSAVEAPIPLYDGDGLAAVMEAAASRNVTVVI